MNRLAPLARVAMYVGALLLVSATVVACADDAPPRDSGSDLDAAFSRDASDGDGDASQGTMDARVPDATIDLDASREDAALIADAADDRDAAGADVDACATSECDDIDCTGNDDCNAGDHCARDGDCRPAICEGPPRCVDGAVYRCADNGTRHALFLRCDSETQRCEDGDAGADCVFTCEPGEPLCNGDVLASCGDDGASIDPGGVDCAEIGQVCDSELAACATKVCEPQTTYCEAGDVQQCIRNGAAERVFEVCAHDEVCDGYPSAGYCRAPLCTEGQSICRDALATSCMNGLPDTRAGMDCTQLPEHSLCIAGACIPVICEPDTQVCVDDATYGICERLGTSAYSRGGCPSNTTCLDGHCVLDGDDAGTPPSDPPDAGALDAAAPESPDGGVEPGSGDPAGCHAPEPEVHTKRSCPLVSPEPPKLSVMHEDINDNYESPVFVTYAPGDDGRRLFVVAAPGLIRIIENGVLLSTPFLDLTGPVVWGVGEMGLFGLAFDPHYEETGRFWVSYSGSTHSTSAPYYNIVVESYRVSADPNVADPDTAQTLLEIDHGDINHFGGMLAFGPDGCLYFGAGDGGGGYDAHATPLCPSGNGQCLSTELGKILRFDVDHPERGAPGNLQGAGIPHIWDYGLRNPWRFSFDRATGDLYLPDVGQDRWEELNIERRGEGHKNYGWRIAEGQHCTATEASHGDTCVDDGIAYARTAFAAPALDYPHANADNCIIGGYVYRGAAIPSLNGYYLYADYGSKRLWAVAWDGEELCAPPIELTQQLPLPGNPSSFGEDADGELYITATRPNAVYRIDPQ